MDDWPLLETGDLPEDLRALLKAELDPGERLLWASRTVPRPTEPGWNYHPLVPWVVTGWILGGAGFIAILGGWFPRLEGVIVFAIAPWFLFAFITSLYILKAVEERRSSDRATRWFSRTCYALTDRRAIIWSPQYRSDDLVIHSIHRGQIDRTVRVEYPDGSGSVTFFYRGVGFASSNDSFVEIPEVRRVEALARATLIGPGRDPGIGPKDARWLQDSRTGR